MKVGKILASVVNKLKKKTWEIICNLPAHARIMHIDEYIYTQNA